jgi:signal recognition particle subunit SRP54
MASRILGMGDILTLIEKAEQSIDEKKAMELTSKLMSNRFTLADFYEQLVSIKGMGSLNDIAGMLPEWIKRPCGRFSGRKGPDQDGAISSP